MVTPWPVIAYMTAARITSRGLIHRPHSSGTAAARAANGMMMTMARVTCSPRAFSVDFGATVWWVGALARVAGAAAPIGFTVSVAVMT